LVVLVSLVGCYMPEAATPSASDLSTMVAKTMEAIQAMTPESMQTPLATPTFAAATVFVLPPTPTPNTGEVSGEICYRNGSMSQLTLYFTNTGTGVVLDFPVSRPQTTYSYQLEPGTYTVYGWPPDYSIGVLHDGGAFQVTAGEETDGIDICDWSHGPFDVPYPPGYSELTGSGSISGGIYGYPYGGLPTMYVVAFNQTTGYWYWVGTAPGVAWYSFDELPAGRYQVVAYDISRNGGGCLNIVTVSGGSAVTCDCNDWSGGYPSMPSGIP
jgi:hypothetical protein